MKGLLIKDFCLLRNQSRTIPIFLILAVWFAVMNQVIFCISFLCMMSVILSMSTCSYDELDHCQTSLFAMPFDRKAYVSEKYVLGIIVLTAGMGIGFLSSLGRQLAVNVRFPYGEHSERITDRLNLWAEDHSGKTVSVDSQEAVFVPKTSPFLKIFADAYEEVTGLKNEFTLEYGGTYAKAMPNIVSWGPIFPDEEDMCHQANEYIGAESLLISTKIFAEAIAGIALSEESFK